MNDKMKHLLIGAAIALALVKFGKGLPVVGPLVQKVS